MHRTTLRLIDEDNDGIVIDMATGDEDQEIVLLGSEGEVCLSGLHKAWFRVTHARSEDQLTGLAFLNKRQVLEAARKLIVLAQHMEE